LSCVSFYNCSSGAEDTRQGKMKTIAFSVAICVLGLILSTAWNSRVVIEPFYPQPDPGLVGIFAPNRGLCSSEFVLQGASVCMSESLTADVEQISKVLNR